METIVKSCLNKDRQINFLKEIRKAVKFQQRDENYITIVGTLMES